MKKIDCLTCHNSHTHVIVQLHPNMARSKSPGPRPRSPLTDGISWDGITIHSSKCLKDPNYIVCPKSIQNFSVVVPFQEWRVFWGRKMVVGSSRQHINHLFLGRQSVLWFYGRPVTTYTGRQYVHIHTVIRISLYAICFCPMMACEPKYYI